MNIYKIHTSQDMHDWMGNWDYRDKDEVKYYLIPMIKFFCKKYKDEIKKYVEEYKYIYLQFCDEGTPEKILSAYVKFRHKQSTSTCSAHLQT
jgi:hypothetical protein